MGPCLRRDDKKATASLRLDAGILDQPRPQHELFVDELCELLQRAGEGVHAALADPAIRQRLDQLGVNTIGSTPAELGAFVKAEMDKWGPLIQSAGIKAE